MHSAEGIECVEVFLFLEVSLQYFIITLMAVMVVVCRDIVGGNGGGYVGGNGGGTGNIENLVKVEGL